MKKKDSKKIKILVVEDDSTLNKVLVNALKEKKVDVLSATNGEEGLKKTFQEKPDLILLDIMMPVMDGMTMLKELRKDEFGKNVFVIILTNAEPSGELIDEASRYPYVSSYLMKSEFGIQEVVQIALNKLKKDTVKKKLS